MQWFDSVFATFLSFLFKRKSCLPATLLVNDRVLPRNYAFVLCFDATEFEKKNNEGFHCLGFLTLSTNVSRSFVMQRYCLDGIPKA